MQNTLRDAIRFDDLWTAYGAQGVVALAWWLGAQHAQRIRREYGSFPLLNVRGRPGSGKSVLLNYLSKLQGHVQPICVPEGAPCFSRARVMASLGREVLMYEVSNERRSSFHWRELFDLYNGGAFLVRPTKGLPVRIPFRGALVISGNSADIDELESRLLRIQLVGFYASEPVSKSVEALIELTCWQAGCFASLAKHCEKEIFEIFSRGMPSYTLELLEEYEDEISERQARNYGQLMSLLDCLCLMLSLSPTKRLLVRQAIQDMLLFETTPY